MEGSVCVCVWRDGWFNEQVPVSAMMGGTVTVVIHTALSTVTVAVVLGALVDTITGTDVVISVQMGKKEWDPLPIPLVQCKTFQTSTCLIVS